MLENYIQYYIIGLNIHLVLIFVKIIQFGPYFCCVVNLVLIFVLTNQPIEFTYDRAILVGFSKSEVTLEISECEDSETNFQR